MTHTTQTDGKLGRMSHPANCSREGRSCGSCAFFSQGVTYVREYPVDVDLGECRINALRIDPSNSHNVAGRIWPVTNSWDWCGGHQPAHCREAMSA